MKTINQPQWVVASAILTLVVALLAGGCGSVTVSEASRSDSKDSAIASNAIQIAPATADAGGVVTLSGSLPGGSVIRVCDALLKNVVFNAGTTDKPVWLLAENTDSSETYVAARGSLVNDVTPGMLCDVVILKRGEPVKGLALPTLTINPSVPAGITNVSVINGFQQSTLLFDAPPDHGASLLNYEFQLEPNGKWTPLNTTQSPLSLTNLTNGRVYHVRLRAVNILGAGPASEPVRLAPFGATVAAGQNYTLATRPSGTLYGWGTQLYGILGDGASNGSTLQPSTYSWGDTSAVPMFTKIVAGGTMAFGLDDQGQAWAWGNGHQGRLGLDGSQDTTRPVNMVFEGLPSGATIVDIAAGQSHGLALDSTGTIWGWGLTISYQLAKPGLNVSAPTPISLGSGIEITAITATIDTSFALDRDGGVWAWGAPGTNLFAGQSVTILQAPTRIVAGDLSAPFQSIDAGGSHVLAIDSDGHLWSWGDNSENQLSHAPTGAPGGPQKVTFAQGAQVIVGAPEGSTVIQVAAGEESSIALDSNGDVWTVGANDSGQLGKSTAPVYFTQVSLQGTGLQGLPVDVAAGPRHKVVIDAEGNAVSWGFNASGELGANSGFGANTDQPQDVKSPF